MDDGGRCLLDVINDPQLLQSFLESDSEGISKDHQLSGGSMTVASNTVLIGCDHVTASGQLSSNASLFTHAPGLKPPVESMGFNCQPADKQNLMGHITLSASNNSSLGLGVSVVSPVSTSSIHLHTLSPSFVNSVRHSSQHPHHPQPSRTHNHKLSNAITVQSMPPPSPHQTIRSPHPPHNASPVWSPGLNNAQLHTVMRTATPNNANNQIGPQNVIIPTSVAQKLQAQQVLYHHHHQQQQQQPTLVPLSLQQQQQVVTTSSVVQFITAPPQNVASVPQTSTTTSARSGRSIQPKQPQQILPKPPNANPVKQAAPTPAPPPPPRAAAVGMGLNQAPQPNHAPQQMMISQNAPSVFTGPQGTIVFNHMLPNMGQTPLLIQGNIGNLGGMQFTLRPQQQTAFTTGGPNATLQHNGAQNNAALIAALQASSQQSQAAMMAGAKHPMHGQHTIMIPSGLTTHGQNLNLSGGQVLHSAHPAQGLMTSRPNFILAPRVMGPHQGFHLHQIQTPNGPMTIALAPGQALTLPQVQSALHNSLAGNSLGPGQVSMPNTVTGQGFFPGISLQPQAQFNQQAVQPNMMPLMTFQKAQEQQQQQVLNIQHSPAPPMRRTSTPIAHSPAPVQQQRIEPDTSDGETIANNNNRSAISTPEPPKPAKAQGLNLAELLKEHGIMPESTPPPSPNAPNSSSDEQQNAEVEAKPPIESLPQSNNNNPVAISMPVNHPTVMQMLQGHSNEMIHPQLKLSMAQDGSIILQPPQMVPAMNVPHQSSLPQRANADPQHHNPPVPAKPPDKPTKASKSHAALLARLNSGTAMAVPTIKANNAIIEPVVSEGSKVVVSLMEPVKLSNANMTSFSSSVIPVTLHTVSSSGSSMPHFTPTVTVSRQGAICATGQNTFPVNSQLNHANHSMVNVVNAKATTTYNCFNHVILGLQPLCNPNPSNISLISTASNSSTTIARGINTLNKNNLCPTLVSSSTPCIMANTATNTFVVRGADPTLIPNCLPTYQPRTMVDTSAQVVQKINENLGASSSHLQQKTPVQTIVPKPLIQKPHSQQVQTTHPSSGTNNPPSANAAPVMINLQVLNNTSVCSSLSRPTMFRHQLIADQDAAVKAFTRKPFSSCQDACRRLLAFHVYHTPKTTDDDFQKADEIFEILSQHLLDRRQKIFDKFQTLMLKEGMRESPSSERVLVEKLFVESETTSLALDKRLASEGKEPCVPLIETPTTSLSKTVLIRESNGCDESSHLSDHKTLKSELKTLQLRLHRSLKRDRAPSPSEDEVSFDHSSKRSNKLLKNTKIERKSPTMESMTADYSLPTQQQLQRAVTRVDVRFHRSENHHRDLLRPIENPNVLQSSSCHLEEDLMSKIRKELNLSPIDHDDHEPNSAHDDFVTAASGLADFELPVARTDRSSNPPSVLSFSGDSRLRSEVNYDFGAMDSSSEWTEAYAEQDKKLFLESGVAVESILNSDDDEGNTPELGLSDIEDLDEQLVMRAEHNFRRGAKEAIAAAEHSLSNSKLGLIGGPALLSNGDIAEGSASMSILRNDTPPSLILNTQVQSAIKSILNFQSSTDNRSYSVDGDHELVSQVLNFNRRIINKENETSEQGPFSMENVSIDYDDYNDEDDDDEDDEDDEELEEEEEEEEELDDDEEDIDDDDDDRGSSGAGANGSVGSNFADKSNGESDAALDEAVRSILL